MADSLHERAEALENGFFAHRDQELLAKLRQEMQAEKTRDALSAAVGITEKEALDALIEHKIEPETLLVIGMIPMVTVAWSDGILEPAEREAIMKAADSTGVKEGTAGYDLLQSWLAGKPEGDLLDAWKSYIAALAKTLDSVAVEQIRDRVIGRAEEVAAAAGGFLGLGRKISESEQKAIDDLTRTFNQTEA